MTETTLWLFLAGRETGHSEDGTVAARKTKGWLQGSKAQPTCEPRLRTSLRRTCYAVMVQVHAYSLPRTSLLRMYAS